MLGTMMDFPLTLPAILDRAGKIFPKIELVSRGPQRTLRRSTYGEMCDRARALAEGLIRAGLRPGERVATLMWNHAVHLEAYFGVPLAGGILHTLNLRLHPSELAYIAKHAEDRFLIVDDALLHNLEKFRHAVNFERVFVVPFAESPSAHPRPGDQSYAALLESARGDCEFPRLDENAGATMCFTSGTTGKPKGVIYSHRALVLHSFAEALNDGFGICQRDTVCQVSSLFHANGWGIPYTSVLVGAKMVFPGPMVDGESLLELYESERVTFTGGVPTVWIGILDALEKHPGRWKLQPNFRGAGAGTAMPESLIRRLDAHGIRIIHLWGMTETTPLATASHLNSYMHALPGDEQYRVRASQGRPVPFVELRACEGDREIQWDGKSLGELQVRGPWVAASYYNFPESANRWTRDGWFCTGDVVSISPEGYIRIADRGKDLIKSGGEWISSVDLENALMGHPAIREAAVIAVPHPKWDERPLAVCVCRDCAPPSNDELREFLAARFAKWQLPDAFVFVEQIPKTSVGKFLKASLREQYAHWDWSA